MDAVDAAIIGSGPNGLVAGALLARAGWKVAVFERNEVAGGAVASAPLTVPGYVHDPYSAFYGILHSSPVFSELDLGRRVEWARFETPVAAAVGPHAASLIHADLQATADGLAAASAEDGPAWLDLYRWWERLGTRFFAMMLAPVGSVRAALPVGLAARRYGIFETAQMQLAPIDAIARDRFVDPGARSLLAAGASHSDVAVDMPGSGPAALILAMAAQEKNMPIPVGGAGRLAAALTEAVTEVGGEVHTGAAVRRVVVESNRVRAVVTEAGEVRVKRAVLADTGPGALFSSLLDEAELPARYLAGLRRFRYGTGVFKLDLAIDGVPGWNEEGLAACGVVHLTGTLDDMARAAFEARHGVLPTLPALIVGQQSQADPSRAPAGGHTLWIETHVPSVPKDHGSWEKAKDVFCDTVLDRLEAHAPGLRGRIVGLHVRTPDELAAENPNLVGGDLGAGSGTIDQQLVFRPVPGWFRYATPVRGLYLCSASTHPGGGVHGMVGRNCARRVLRDRRRRRI
ncbi:MAG TPA: NAD(P)/FAD-dependent oxidoreductase [Acidimicrobiales bacterium]|nr:NAD(P)/FAD-dependent oxidoreductase [Acidimicrobiales bacterium]